MTGWKAKYQGKWYDVKEVKDSGKPAGTPDGGNHYHLDGVGPVHQSKIEDLDMGGKKKMDKQDRIETTADGKTELDVGAEPLDKNPSDEDKKKGKGAQYDDALDELKHKWKKLKKALDSNTSILDLKQAQEDEDDQAEGGEGSQEQAPQGEGEPTEQDQEQGAEPAGDDESLQDPNEDQVDPEMGQEPSEGSEVSPEDEQELSRLLMEEGYNESEIAHIVHGHITPEATVDDHKANNEMIEGQLEQQNLVQDAQQEREHKKRMHDVEYEKARSDMADPETEKQHRKRMLDLEHETAEGKKHQSKLDVDHKKRMLDLEYAKAQKEAEKQDPTEDMKAKQLEFDLQMKRMEKELELEYKKKELELKLKIQEEAGAQKAEHAAAQAEEDAKTNAAVKKEQAKHKIAEAKKPPQKDKDK